MLTEIWFFVRIIIKEFQSSRTRCNHLDFNIKGKEPNAFMCVMNYFLKPFKDILKIGRCMESDNRSREAEGAYIWPRVSRAWEHATTPTTTYGPPQEVAQTPS